MCYLLTVAMTSSLWTSVLKSLVEFTLSHPCNYLSGVLIFSELLPIPLPIQVHNYAYHYLYRYLCVATPTYTGTCVKTHTSTYAGVCMRACVCVEKH